MQAMSMRLIQSGACEAMPWKNGGGVTRELYSYPPAAGFDSFLWRASIADVHASGPFSSFPGIDRIIMLLDGPGMDLDIAGSGIHALRQCWVPFRFRGEETVHAEMAGVPCRDFNFMVRRDLADAAFHVRREAGRIEYGPNDFLFLFCLAGRWRIALPEGEIYEISKEEALSGQPVAAVASLTPMQSGSVLAVVTVRQLPGTGASDVG